MKRWQRQTVGMAWGMGLCVAALACAQQPKAGTAKASGFSAQTVEEKARSLAAKPYQEPPIGVPPSFEKLTYDQYRDIRFRDSASLWREEALPFRAQFFHPGFYYTRPVGVNVVEGGKARPVPFSTEQFTYGPLVGNPPKGKVNGFAGFRLNAPLNTKDYYDELVVFLGASYFRALGKGNLYGLSARGLAIDTAQPGGEEFPTFREFWLETPAKGSDTVVVHALMDSPSVTGAYRFAIRPGERTVMDVDSTVFARKAVRQLGVAPLTSMFLFGENDRGDFDDFRPEVHDSDGISVWTKNGEKLWRPLKNPKQIQTSSFHTDGLSGFGLLQRDQAFTSYEDLEAHSERRPGAWVEPVGDWGAGSVRLVELPTREEIHDNIVAFWVPDAPVQAGAHLRFSYRLSWGFSPEGAKAGGSTVAATRVAAGSKPGARRFVLDFTKASVEGTGPVEAVVTASRGQVLHPRAEVHAVTGGFRAAFELMPDGEGPVELRCFLKRGSETLTETWSYLWIP
ncbi:glucan biosynthesis protein [Corallococcus exiguus]|nr:glucan biosynthesis protein [Corallococcus exiguus]MBN8467807.1 glucan biosynthesis protein [Corallococcus exiguus]